jgi:hypothetical protein
MATVCRETVILAGRLDIPAASVTALPFRSFVSQLLQAGAESSRPCPRLHFLEVVLFWPATIITDEMIAVAAGSFQRQTTVIARDVRLVNFSCDAATILHIKVMHSGLADPTAIPDILPLNPQVNDDWNAE